MSLKRWVLGKVHGDARAGTEGRRAPSLHGSIPEEGDERDGFPKAGAASEANRPDTAHLGPYAPLIAAIREELEHFVESQLRLHLAIAERDQYVLTSIEIECPAHDEHEALLRRFVAEFKPEQIKRYLARDVIAGLRNASAIDLSQFAGLNHPREAHADEADDPYGDLIADLKRDSSGTTPRGFEVTLVGRWVQGDLTTSERAQARASGPVARDGRRQTPLAGRTLTVDIEDAGGARSLELDPVVPGRRYGVGKGDECEVRVEGTYASRRHCEIWLDGDAWWVADAGSTNGVRVEAKGSIARSDSGAGKRIEPIEVPAAALLILSAFAQGDARLYPRLTLRPNQGSGARAPHDVDSTTPLTPLAPSPPRKGALMITATMASGTREVELTADALPFGIGRSRKESLTVDRAYSDVSGRHVEIVSIDDGGVWATVLGDNGVEAGGKLHAAGEKFLWRHGETMRLGSAESGAALCALALSLAE